MALKICHVCNGHRADDGRVFHRACVGLAKAGYEVHLLAVGKAEGTYTDKGVVIHSLPPSRGRRQRFGRAAQIAQQAADLAPDLFHVHEPDLLGPVLARAAGRPVLYDVHESYLDILSESDWVPDVARPFVRFAWDQWERSCVRRCSGVIAVTEPIAARYSTLHRRVAVVANYPDLESLQGLPAVHRDGKTCVFAGALTPDAGLSEMFKAFAILVKRGVDVTLTMAGPAMSPRYLESLWDEAKRLGIWDRLQYHGMLSRRDALALQHHASIGLIPYQPFRSSTTGLPNKLMECMAVGLPVVFSDFPVYRQVAGEAGAGIAIDPTKPGALADAIEYLIRNPTVAQQMGAAGQRVVRERFNWDCERVKLLGLYQDVLGVAVGPFTIVPMRDGDMVAEAAEVHRKTFAGYLNTSLGTGYLQAFLRWFVHAQDAIALAAVDSRGRVVGYAVGARSGYSRAMNRALWAVTAMALLRRPRLLLEARLWEKLWSRLVLLIRNPAQQCRDLADLQPTLALVALAVAPAVRNSGIGSRLMEACESHARRISMRSLELSVHRDNVRARRFYERCGWRSGESAIGELNYWRAVEQPIAARMRILLITQYYPPEIGAAQNRLSALVRHLRDAGHEVVVATAFPSYPGGEIVAPYRSRVVMEERRDGVRVIRTWIYARKQLGFIGRLIGYLSFAASALVTLAVKVRRQDAIIVESPPLFLGPTGWLLARIQHAKFVFNVSDLWPQTAVDMGMLRHPLLIRWAQALETFLYRKADLITGQTMGIVNDIRTRFPQKPVLLMTNGIDPQRFRDADSPHETGRRRPRFVVGYAGLHGHMQSLETVIDSGGLLQEHRDIAFVFYGDGPRKEQLRKRASDARLSNIEFHPPQAVERMTEILASFSAVVIPMRQLPISRGAIPSKMLEAMAAGVPILLAGEGEAEALVRDADCGVVVPPEDAAALARAILRLYQDESYRNRLGRNARSYAVRRFERGAINRSFELRLAEIIHGAWKRTDRAVNEA